MNYIYYSMTDILCHKKKTFKDLKDIKIYKNKFYNVKKKINVYKHNINLPSI